MQEIEAKHFHLIAGAGNFSDNRGSNGRVNNNGGNKNGGGKSSDGNMYQKHTSPDCVNGILTGSLGGLGGLAVGALNGGCFKEGSKGGGNVGMGKGGNKNNSSNCNNNSNKGGNTCSR